MTSVYDLFVYLLEPVDLKGQSRAAVIASVSVENVFNPRSRHAEPALVVVFERARKHMKLNKTQAKALMQITGTDDYSKWAGTRIILTPSPSPNGRDTIVITAQAPEATYQDDPDMGGAA